MTDEIAPATADTTDERLALDGVVEHEDAYVRVVRREGPGGTRFDWYDKSGLAAGHSPDADAPAPGVPAPLTEPEETDPEPEAEPQA